MGNAQTQFRQQTFVRDPVIDSLFSIGSQQPPRAGGSVNKSEPIVTDNDCGTAGTAQPESGQSFVDDSSATNTTEHLNSKKRKLEQDEESNKQTKLAKISSAEVQEAIITETGNVECSEVQNVEINAEPTLLSNEISTITDWEPIADGNWETNTDWETTTSFVANQPIQEPEQEPEQETCNVEVPISTNSVGKKVFRFFWWDAYENNHLNTVDLFGKFYDEVEQKYASCCVTIKNMEWKLILLPNSRVRNGEKKTYNTALVHDEFDFNSVCFKIKRFIWEIAKKKFAFDGILSGYCECVQIRYPTIYPRIEYDFDCLQFSRIFGSKTGLLELLLTECKIKGPCWLEVVEPQIETKPNTSSSCKLEVSCDITKLSVSQNQEEPPPLVVASLNIVTDRNDAICMIGCVVQDDYCIGNEVFKPLFQQHFCYWTTSSEESEVQNFKKNFSGESVKYCMTEHELIDEFVLRFMKIDPDFVVGYDLLGPQFGVLSKFESRLWSRIGKLRSPEVLMQKNLIPGRLVCDLKVLAEELLTSGNNDFNALCETILNVNDRTVIAPSEMFDSAGNFFRFIAFLMRDASYMAQMLSRLDAIALALDLTHLTGCLMSMALQGNKTGRSEYCLVHAFHDANYIVPDKEDHRTHTIIQSSANKKTTPSYLGGLVLEPKTGFYDEFILVMDFKSLYPSIIQEYNICFSTVQPFDGNDFTDVKISPEPGFLPNEISKLVEARRKIQMLMSDPAIDETTRSQLNIRQRALKLTANSLCGYLGYTKSRFPAKHLAALVSFKGREILEHTKRLIEELKCDVIYGDTDSLMINTHCTDYDQVVRMGNEIKAAVNQSYRYIQIDIDSIYKYLLLLRKKKYGAVSISKANSGDFILQQVHKGLELMHRDWPQVACDVGKMVLKQIFCKQSPEERTKQILALLSQVARTLRTEKRPLQVFVISKQLAKDPSEYTESSALAHVHVALRYNRQGGKILTRGDTVPYVVCKRSPHASVAERAYHYEEVANASPDLLAVDVDYYLMQQILPMVVRLCEPFEGLGMNEIGKAIGLKDTVLKQLKLTQIHSEMDSLSYERLCELQIPEKRYDGAKPFTFTCGACNASICVTNVRGTSETCYWLSKCINSKCKRSLLDYLPDVREQLTAAIEQCLAKYKENKSMCNNVMCMNVSATGTAACDVCPRGIMYKLYPKEKLHNQLLFFKHLCNVNKTEHKGVSTELENGYRSLLNTVNGFLQAFPYHNINLTQLFWNTDVLRDKDVN